MPTTITIKERTKEILREMKGDKDWDSFLRELAENYLKMKREEVRAKLKKMLTEEYDEVRVKKWAREY